MVYDKKAEYFERWSFAQEVMVSWNVTPFFTDHSDCETDDIRLITFLQQLSKP